MNPFDLPGPEFLGFYLILGGVALFSLATLRRRREAALAAPPRLEDPYSVACLRGGVKEALQVALLSLIDRGLLRVQTSDESGVTLQTTRPDASELARHPLEKEILKACRQPISFESALTDPSSRSVCRKYAEELERMGLLPDDALRRARQQLFLVTAGILGSVAAVKILVALSRGRFNITFLVLAAVAFGWLARLLAHPPQTAQGKRLLTDLKTLFASLKNRASELLPGGGSTELPWLAALFGLEAVPVMAFPWRDQLLPPPKTEASSMESSSGSSCGSSCGGGCGGGCGGCGG